MNTLLKILGFVALGVGVLIVGGILLGMVTAALKLLVPIAILAGIGYVAYRVMSGGSTPEPAKQEEKQQPLAAPKTEEKKGISAEEAAKRFEEMKKGQPH